MNSNNKVKLRILSGEREDVIETKLGLGLQAICLKHKTSIEFSCRKADCGICAIKIVDGAENINQPSDNERDFLKAMHADSDERLGCQVRLFGDVTIRTDYL